MNPVLQEILHNITSRLAALEQSAQSDKLLIDLIQEQRAEIDRLRAAQPEQEPVAWQEMVVANLVRLGVVKHKAKELAYHFYTYDPPSKQWVGLTDAELAEFSAMKLGAYDLCLEVEAKLREKNA